MRKKQTRKSYLIKQRFFNTLMVFLIGLFTVGLFSEFQKLQSSFVDLRSEAALAGQIIAETELFEQAVSLPGLSDTELPDFELAIECTFDPEVPRLREVEFRYINNTGYKIELDSSLVSLDFMDISQFDEGNDYYENELAENLITLSHLHTESSKFARIDQQTLPEQDIITFESYNTLIPSEKDLWKPLINKGAIDFLIPGEQTGMTFVLPTDYTIRWETVVQLTSEQQEFFADNDRVTDKLLFTAVSAYNGTDCFNTVVDYDIEIPETIPHEINNPAGYTARTVNTKECKIPEVVQEIDSATELSIDPDTLLTIDLKNQVLLTERIGTKHAITKLQGADDQLLTAGEYVVLLQSYDEHGIKHKTQENEAYYVEFLDKDENVIKTTSTIKDLWDTEEGIVQIVDTTFTVFEEQLQDITHLWAVDADTWEEDELLPNGQPDNKFLTSIKTTCMGLVKIDEAQLETPAETGVVEALKDQGVPSGVHSQSGGVVSVPPAAIPESVEF